jgi:group I intron endonuclease
MKLNDQFEKLPGVYIIKCLKNDKIYVGETINIKNRLRRYKKERSQLIGRALDKYGDEYFEVYVEYFPNFKKSDLIDLEEELIIKFNSLVPNGYNVCCKGTDGTGRKHTDETKKKIGMTHKGKTVSAETRQKLSIAGMGKTQTIEFIEYRTGKTKKPIIQLDRETEDVIREWDSIKSATVELSNGKNRSGDISKAIKGIKMKTALGFKWRFKV